MAKLKLRPPKWSLIPDVREQWQEAAPSFHKGVLGNTLIWTVSVSVWYILNMLFPTPKPEMLMFSFANMVMVFSHQLRPKQRKSWHPGDISSLIWSNFIACLNNFQEWQVQVSNLEVISSSQQQRLIWTSLNHVTMNTTPKNMGWLIHRAVQGTKWQQHRLLPRRVLLWRNGHARCNMIGQSSESSFCDAESWYYQIKKSKVNRWLFCNVVFSGFCGFKQ